MHSTLHRVVLMGRCLARHAYEQAHGTAAHPVAVCCFVTYLANLLCMLSTKPVPGMSACSTAAIAFLMALTHFSMARFKHAHSCTVILMDELDLPLYCCHCCPHFRGRDTLPSIPALELLSLTCIRHDLKHANLACLGDSGA